MPQYCIERIDDPRIAPYRDLPGGAGVPQSDLFVVEGRWLVERLLSSDFITESILVEARRIETIRPRLRPETPVYVASRDLIRQILGFSFHRGVIACGRRKPPCPLDQVLPACRRQFLVVACVDIRDPENLGGILRNCAAFGVDAVLVSRHSASPFSRRPLRVSMGAALDLPIVCSPDLGRDLDLLRRQRHAQLVAAVLSEKAMALKTADRPDRLVLLFGNEARGLSSPWLDRCDRQVTVPMQPGTDSLNVAVASGIFLYHFTRESHREHTVEKRRHDAV